MRFELQAFASTTCEYWRVICEKFASHFTQPPICNRVTQRVFVDRDDGHKFYSCSYWVKKNIYSPLQWLHKCHAKYGSQVACHAMHVSRMACHARHATARYCTLKTGGPMKGTDWSHDLFDTKFNRRCDGWSIDFQTPYNEPEDSKVNTCRETIYELEADSFWCSAKNLESRGVEGIKNKLVNPTRIVNNPSYEVVEN